jgi:hypothetical protein
MQNRYFCSGIRIAKRSSMLYRFAFVATLALVGSVSARASADPVSPQLPSTHVSLRAGIAAASQWQSFEVFTSATPDYQLSGTGLSIGAALTVGPSNARWLSKLENVVIPSGDQGTSGGMALVTTGIQYNGSRAGTSFVSEATLGLSLAHGRMYDQGYTACDFYYCNSSQARSASWQEHTLTTAILQIGVGARVDDNLEIIGDLWLGALTAGGASINVGYQFSL